MSIQTFFVKISSETNHKFSDLIKKVSIERQHQLAKFRNNVDFKLSLYSELLVRYQICKTLGIKNNEIEFIKNKHGKPYLKSHPEFHFNISHTRNAISIAFAEDEIGVDIESIQSPKYNISKRFFTPSEQGYILYNATPDQAFYEIWTKKEAYIKCIGTGLFIPLKSFDVLDYGIESMMHTVNMGEYIISICCKNLLSKKATVTIMTEAELQTLF